MAVAKRLCPHAVIRPVRMDLYRRASDRMFAILVTFSRLVEPLSIDEAFLDIRGALKLMGSPGTIARGIRARVLADHVERFREVFAGFDPNWFYTFLGVMLLLAVLVNLYVKNYALTRR